MNSRAQDEVGFLPPQLKYNSLVHGLPIPGLTGIKKDSAAISDGAYLEFQCLES